MTAKRQSGDCMGARDNHDQEENGQADRGRANKRGEAEKNKTAADKANRWNDEMQDARGQAGKRSASIAKAAKPEASEEEEGRQNQTTKSRVSKQ